MKPTAAPLIFTLLIALTFAFGCTQKRTQPAKEGLNPPPASAGGGVPIYEYEATNPGGGNDIDLGGTDLTQEEIDRLVETNSRKPILFGKGAGGVDMNTTLDEAKNILWKPVRSTVSQFTTTNIYSEGLFIRFLNDSRVPLFMLVLGNYLGALELPAPYGPVKMGRSFGDFFSNASEAEDFARNVYRHFEGKGSDYDCIAEKRCSVDDSNAQFLSIQSTGLTLILEKNDQNSYPLFRMVIERKMDAGKLSGDFDIINGVTKSEDGDIAVGKSWKETSELADADGITVKSSTDFAKILGGIQASISRSKPGRDYREPDENEKYQGIILSGDQYLGYIRINDKFLNVQKNPNGKTVTIYTDTKPATDAEGVPLQLQMKGLAENPDAQKDFILKLGELIKESLAAKHSANPNMRITNSFSGMFATGLGREFGGAITAFDQVSNKGEEISFEISESNGSMSFTYFVLESPFAKDILPTLEKADVAEKSLGGFTLGDDVTLTNVDALKEEAVLVAEDGRKKNIRYIKNNKEDLWYRNGADIQNIKQKMSIIRGLGGVTLGFTPTEITKSEDKGKVIKGKVVLITSSSIVTTITGFCENKPEMTVDLKANGGLGMDLAQLKDLIRTHSDNDKCVAIETQDPDDRFANRPVFFPTSQSAILVSGNRPTGVLIYERADAFEPAEEEGGEQ